MGYVALIAGWIVYFFLHSLLAAGSVKRLAERLLGRVSRFYRLGYSILSTLGLIALLFLNDSIPGDYYFAREGPMRYLGIAFITMGVILVQVSFRQYRLKAFLGFLPEQPGLRRHGVLGWIRHPIYAGLILLTTGLFLFVPNFPTLISCLCIFCYLPIGMALEERKLVLEYGQAYKDYCKEVPALIPRWSRLVGN